MEFKLHDHKYELKGNFQHAANCIKLSLELLGYTETKNDNADLHVYNHTCRDLEPDMPENSIIFKPTAPTSKHFQICTLGYANSSEITFKLPVDYIYRKHTIAEWDGIQDLVKARANKWDDSILLKFKDVKNVKDDHILVIGQMPDDETVNGFGFRGHLDRIDMILDKLKGENVVLKLHPRFKPKTQSEALFLRKWEGMDIQILKGYGSIHSVLPKTRVAIVDNSTAGIECMMHDVPIISYGYPDYHWRTIDLRSLTQLKGFINSIPGPDFIPNKELTRRYLCWYIYEYLCSDINTTVNRLKKIL